ncbi:MAG: hypothetical protein GX304_06165 [Clostridiales bacterium]|jgi:stage III sporulation protein AE|nr:hypothetical protein [Clostridiales bacterium]
MRKKFALKIIILLALAFTAIFPAGQAFAEDEKKDVEEQLQESVRDQLKDLDTSLFDKFIYSLDEPRYRIFGAGTFKDKLLKVISGEVPADIEDTLSVFAEIFFAEALRAIPIFASIAAVAILSSLLTFAKSEKFNSGQIVYFVCYIAIVVIVLNIIYQIVKNVNSNLKVMNELMGLVFPVLLTLMTASGSAMAGTIYQPAVALLCGSATGIIINIIVPLFVGSIILSVVSNLTDKVKVSKFADFFKSCGQWVTGILFTVFMAFLSIQGITASTHDSVSIRAVKYAISNSIPLVGGYIKEGFDLIVGGTLLIKNAVGVSGLVLFFCHIITPLMSIIICSLGLKLVAAVCEPLCDPKIPAFLQGVAKNFSLLLAAFVSVCFMFTITVMLILMTSNSVMI